MTGPRPIQVRPDLTFGQRLWRTALVIVAVVTITVSLISLAESTHANAQAAMRSKHEAAQALAIAKAQVEASQRHFCNLFNLLLNTPRPANAGPPTPAQRRFTDIITTLRDQAKCR